MTGEHQASEYGLEGSAEMDAQMRRRRSELQADFLSPHLKPGSTLIDIGCGQGTITVGLAEAVAPGMVRGFDLQKQHIESARGLAREKGLKNVQFEVGDIHNLPCAPDSFDVAYANAVFFHLADPKGALSVVHRILRAGGVLGVRDTGVNDIKALVFEGRGAKAARRAMEIMADTMVAASKNPYGGRQGLVMNHLCHQAGFDVLEIVGQWEISRAAETLAVRGDRLPIEGPVGDRAIQLGLTTREEIEDLGEEVRRHWFTDPEAFSALPWFAVVARKR